MLALNSTFGARALEVTPVEVLRRRVDVLDQVIQRRVQE